MTKRWRSILVAALIAAVAVAQPLRVAAQAAEDPTVERFDAEKFWSYAGCAAGIAVSVGTGGWVIAVLACGKVATAYWTK